MTRETTGGRMVKCPRCGQQVFRRAKDGRVLRHTTPAFGGGGYFGFISVPYTPAEVCE